MIYDTFAFNIYIYVFKGDAIEKLAAEISPNLEKVQSEYYATPSRLQSLKDAKNNNKIVCDHDNIQITDTTASTKGTVGSISRAIGRVAGEIQSVSEKIYGISGDIGSISEKICSISEEVGSISEEIGSVSEEIGSVSEESSSIGTVGCVVMYNGHVSAATSTGIYLITIIMYKT